MGPLPRLLLPLAVSLSLIAAAAAPTPSPEAFAGLRFRNLGPFRGGRVGAVAGVPGKPQLYYMGAAGGGLWRTEDGGASWRNLSDGFFRTGSVGAIGVCDADPNVIYVGMGEDTIRGNVSRGDGVYRSTDAGRTWTHLGLEDTQQITRVRVNPANPEVAYVAALGHVWGPNAERGIFRTQDGGKTWKKVLYVNENTGASDLCMDPANPRILYAGFWQVGRRPWTLESGGPGSGVYKSTDGGDTWKRLEGGLPTGVLGRIGIAVSPARPDRVWAIVEAEKGGLYRSDDAGATWTLVNGENQIRQRAWYYSRIYADPKNADTVYALNVAFLRSQDGGRTFAAIPTPHGDNHDLWIAPEDPRRMIEGNDGGATVTVNAGESWSTLLNQPTAQFYRVAVDSRDPYWIYGCQQDNTSVAIRSRAEGRGGVTQADWHAVGGGESGWIAPEPKDPDVVFAGEYGGQITRNDHRTGETRMVMAWPQLAIGMAPKDLKYRFQWNAPILISRFEPHVLYHAAQVLLRSADRGRTWEEISPDLTRNDKATQIASGGPITKDNTGVEVFNTIFALAESRQDPAILWAGSDDGLIHLTRDGGKTWTDITPKGLPANLQINSIDPSPFDAGTAYVAATAYKLDDLKPYLLRTTDFGKSWTRIDAGIPVGAFTRVVRADELRRGLLFAGTETGLYLSFDDGASWQPFQRNLPVVPVTDLAIHRGDLIVATQGRSFWILDDLDSLRQWKPEVAAEPLHVFQPRPAVRADYGQAWWMEDDAKPRAQGQNPPTGALLDLWLKEAPDDKDPLTLEVLSGTEVLRSFSSRKPEKPEPSAEKPLKLHAGFNRVTWDLRMFRPHLLPKAIVWGDTRGPEVAPGTYTLRVSYRGATATRDLVVKPRPGTAASEADLKAQADFLQAVRDRVTEIHQSVLQIRDVKAQVKGLLERAEKLGKAADLKAPAKALTDRLDALEARLVNPRLKSDQDVLNFTPGLDHQFIGLAGMVGEGDGAPSPAARAYYDQEKAVLAGLQAELAQAWSAELAAFDKAVQAAGIPPVIVVPAAK
ncbi:MAG TPA: hypothetical protein VF804_02435 [Holophagaceae bacterium]